MTWEVSKQFKVFIGGNTYIDTPEILRSLHRPALVGDAVKLSQ